MSSVTLGPIPSNTNMQFNTAPRTKLENPEAEKIDKQLNAEGRQKIGEKALDAAIKQLSDMFAEREVRVSTVFDANSGIQQVHITDGETGRKIAELPPRAAVEIAERAKQKSIGWLIDTFR